MFACLLVRLDHGHIAKHFLGLVRGVSHRACGRGIGLDVILKSQRPGNCNQPSVDRLFLRVFCLVRRRLLLLNVGVRGLLLSLLLLLDVLFVGRLARDTVALVVEHGLAVDQKLPFLFLLLRRRSGLLLLLQPGRGVSSAQCLRKERRGRDDGGRG